ncbi:MAG: CDP-alcohol phosphatidyltransferase family protein [Bdellovibrio sp.]|nr:CDP-alcohol phosphatidyltransferase family protein [Bdellovibrio sp.]
MNNSSRREVKSRQTKFAQVFAKKLADTGISPNSISLMSMIYSLLALIFFILAKDHRLLLIAAVLMIQLRLLCNLFDGMVAVEFNRKSAVGELYNEVPDRISDFLILLGAGLFISPLPYSMDLAWFNIFLATMTAYIRVFGAALTGKHHFLGPMAKQHRMFLISLGALASLIYQDALFISLFAMSLFLIATLYRRIAIIAQHLKTGELHE